LKRRKGTWAATPLTAWLGRRAWLQSEARRQFRTCATCAIELLLAVQLGAYQVGAAQVGAAQVGAAQVGARHSQFLAAGQETAVRLAKDSRQNAAVPTNVSMRRTTCEAVSSVALSIRSAESFRRPWRLRPIVNGPRASPRRRGADGHAPCPASSNFSVLNWLGPSGEKLLKLGFGGLDDLVVHRLDQSVK
jgi:hypothetical protein